MSVSTVPEPITSIETTEIGATYIIVTWDEIDICSINGDFVAYYLSYSYTDPLEGESAESHGWCCGTYYVHICIRVYISRVHTSKYTVLISLVGSCHQTTTSRHVLYMYM